MRHTEQESVGDQPDSQTDTQVKGCPANHHPWQDFQRKNNLLDIAGVGENQARRPIDALGKKVKNHQPREKNERKLGFGITPRLPAGLKNDAEHEGIDRKHEHGVKK